MKFLKELLPYIVIIIVVVLIRTFIITPVMVDGTSMSPTLKNNQILLLKKYDEEYSRFKVIVFNYNGEKLVKRIIGLPFEHIKYVDNQLYINDEQLEDVKLNVTTKNFDLTDLGYQVIPENCYYVLGDNRNNSVDSRIIGVVCQEDIIGVSDFRLFPFTTFGFFK